MKPLTSFWFALMLIAVIIGAGCTQQEIPPPTPTIPPTTLTPEPTTPQVPTTTPVSLIPGPTVTVPPGFDVIITSSVDPIARKITVVYNGGKAGILLQRIDIVVTTPAREIITREIARQDGSIPAGSDVTIPTTSGTHRLEITATINGVDYKIHDELIQV
ncbi:MAG: hypothetical protein LUO82_06250 [Methanomicrobiales archaeon]|nr:hypothetical protein [Methanomicrobiales archaeon]